MHDRQRLLLAMGVGCLVLVEVAGCGGGGTTGGGGGGSTGGGGNPPPTLNLAFSPTSVTVNPGVSFPITIQSVTSGTSATPTVTLGTLPAGLSTTTAFPLSVPASGATINLTAAGSTVPGTYTISASGSAGSATSNASLTLQVQSGTPVQASFPIGITEYQVVQGSSTTFSSQVFAGSYYSITLGATGLPPGVTATFNPQVVVTGDQFTVKLAASSTAPAAQNVQWTITGTPAANVAPAISNLLLDVTPPSSAGWTNRTSYVPTRATPYSAVYDSVHGMIYSANQVWNRVDVISDATRKIVKSISIRDPRGMDLSIDGSTVWVATGSPVMYGINTTTQQATLYQLPPYKLDSTSSAVSWEGINVFALADGTVLLETNMQLNESVLIWNPSTNSFTQPSAFASAPWGVIARSGNGKIVFSAGMDELETSFSYNVATQAISTPVQLSSFGYAAQVAVNTDGSRVAITTLGTQPFGLYDGSLKLIGTLPGDGGKTAFPPLNEIYGGPVFSPDGSFLYEETEAYATPVILQIDVASLKVVGHAPAMPVIPVGWVMTPPFFIPIPFAVDSSGMVLGIQYEGIAFDDSTAQLNYASDTPGALTNMQHMSVYSGPLAGGTTSGEFGNGSSVLPDVYYGSTKGTASLSEDILQITSPPSTTSGPVDIKMLFPGGNEVYDPLFFTFGTQIQDAIVSAAGPAGGVPATLDAFGLPLDPSQDTLTIGGSTATVTSTVTQYPPFTDQQTAMLLSYTVPPGSPGRADITVSSPNGTGTLSKGFFYAKSVTDYPMTDFPNNILYDKGRNQLYLSAGNHIDVFSLSSLTFSAPLTPPVTGTNFVDLSLTPDGKTLLAAEYGTGALAVIDPDTPQSSYEINVLRSVPGYSQCSPAAMSAVPDNQGNAVVSFALISGPAGCPGQLSELILVNLITKSLSVLSATGCNTYVNGSALVANSGGSLIGIVGGGEFSTYIPSQHMCIANIQTPPWGALGAVSGDGNVYGLAWGAANPSGALLGRNASPVLFYPGAATPISFDEYRPSFDKGSETPVLNDAGSLAFYRFPGHIDILDIQHGTLTLRFALSETGIGNMAIDSGGQRIFLITNQGLTVVDLGNAPLSIGHLSQTSTARGTQVVVRGSGFENGISASLAGVSAPVTITDDETLTFTVPSVSPGLQDLSLSNPDGTVYTLQNALTVE